MASGLATMAGIYKIKYAGGKPGDVAMRDRPLLSMMPKQSGFDGFTWNYFIRYANPQGIALGTLADAQTAVSNSKGVQLACPRKVYYGDIEIDCVSAMAAKNRGDGAFYDLVTLETDSILDELGDRTAHHLYRGSAALGQIASGGVSGDVLTFATPDDARNFKVGMTVIADDTATGASPRAGTTTVAQVNLDAGTVTLTSAAAITATALDYIFAYGSVDSGMIDGLAIHIPLTAPTGSDTFRGLATPGRGADPGRLAGRRLNDTTMMPEDAARLVAVKINQEGKKANKLFLNPLRFYEVSRRLDAKIVYDGGGDSAAVGFETFKLHTAAGALTAVADPNCPVDRGYVLKLEDWYFKYLGPGFVHIAEDDGIKMLRKATTDVMEARSRIVGNTVCEVPGAQGVFSCAT